MWKLQDCKLYAKQPSAVTVKKKKKRQKGGVKLEDNLMTEFRMTLTLEWNKTLSPGADFTRDRDVLSENKVLS